MIQNKISKALSDIKKRLADAHDMRINDDNPAGANSLNYDDAEGNKTGIEWESNIEKVTNLLEYQNAKIAGIIEDFKGEQDEIEQEIKQVLEKINENDED